MGEREVQRAVHGMLEWLGFHVSSLSQGYRPGGRRHGTTRQTKGLPDLYWQHPRYGTGWIEVKGPKTRVTEHQKAWHEQEQRAGGRIAVVRSQEDLAWALVAWGVPIVPKGGPREEMVEQFPELEEVA